MPLITKCSASTVYEATRSQAPKFGMDGTATLLFRDICPETNGGKFKTTLQLSFGNGLFTLPRFEVMSNAKISSPTGSTEVTVQFYHTSDGQIHSISKQHETSENPNDLHNAGKVFVNYKWVEEDDVDIAGGVLVMFFAIFGIGLYQIALVILSIDEYHSNAGSSSINQRHGAYRENSEYRVSGGYGDAKRA